MRTQRTLIATGILLSAVSRCLGQSTVEFSSSLYEVPEFMGRVLLAVQRTGDTSTAVSVDYASANGTAIAGSDYTETHGTLSFGAGETNQTITIPILNDGLGEAMYEKFTVTLSNPTHAVLGARVIATGLIADNDKGLQLELASYSVNEDAGEITIRVLRRDDGDFPVSVDYATTHLTAVDGDDYVDLAGTLHFAAGDTLKTVTIKLLNDATRESSETFRFSLSNVSGGVTLGTPKTATVTISDTDDLVMFQAAGLTHREDVAFARVPVARGESKSSSTVDVITADGTAVAGLDYTGLTNTISFAPGERLKFIDVLLLNDGLKESSETFRTVLSNPTGGAVLGSNATVTVTILDNDPGVGFERSTTSVWEKEPGLTLNVIRGNDGWLGPFTVDYQIVNGSAVAGVDYQANSGTLSFATNEMVREITVLVLPDWAPEGTKSFTVTLSNPTGQIPGGRTSCSVAIVDHAGGNLDQAQPTVSAAIANHGGLVQVSWLGTATVSRADSITGPWEHLGTTDGPLFATSHLPGAFYQIRSPRSARIYLPSSYDGQTPRPLVIVLHGLGGDASWIRSYFQFESLAEARQFLVCYPEGTVDRSGDKFWNATDGCCNFYGSIVDDSTYLRTLIEELAERYKVDRKRIYITGLSNGGYMSHRMACDHADLIAGIASLAGVTFLDPGTHRPSQQVHVLQIHGTADQTVPYAGGAFPVGWPIAAMFPGAVATVHAWADFNGCKGPQWDTQPSMDLDLAVAGVDTRVMRYTNSPPGGAVELWTINGGAHAPTLYSGSTRSEYSARVIDWLLAHPKP